MEYLLIAILIVLGLLLILKEIMRDDRGQQFWRVIASATAVVVLYLILYPPSFEVQGNPPPGELVFLSRGAHIDSIPSQTPAFTDDADLHRQHKQLQFIPDLNQYLKAHPTYSSIKLYGYGLPREELKQLKEYAIQFHPTALGGFLNIHWSRKLVETAPFLVQGTYRNTGAQTLKLQLTGLGNKLDSITLLPKSTTKFSLKAHPQLIGSAVYKLEVLRGKDTLAAEPLPFTIKEAEPMRILILAAYPDFEFKFLKNWLYENKYPVIFRTQISKDKFSTDYLNTKNIGLSNLNLALLKKIDVLIIDEETHQGLAAQEKSAVLRAIQSGMGMLLLGKSNQALQQSGQGKIRVAAGNASYPLLLAGKKSEYSTHWSTKLNDVARRKTDTLSWSIHPQITVPGSRSRLIIDLASGTGITDVKINRRSFPILQNMEMNFQWQVMLWPELSGWNSLQVNDRKDLFYVFKFSDWRTIRDGELLRSTEEWVRASSSSVHPSATPAKKTKEISLWWLYLLFLMSAAYLWYEQRFLCNKIN